MILGPTSKIDLVEVFRQIKTDTMAAINCVQIGTIEAYDSLLNTAKVSVNMQRQLIDGKIINYPVLGDVPIMILSGGGSAITFPIAKGDFCIVLFNDRNIDNWWASGQIVPPDDARCHSISDAMAIVGIRNISSAKLNPMGSVCIDGGSKKVTIKNSTTDLLTLIQNLITTISGLVTSNCVVGSPVVIGTTGQTALSSLSTQFATLLDKGAL